MGTLDIILMQFVLVILLLFNFWLCNISGQSTNFQAALTSAAFTAVMDVGYDYPDAGDVIPFNKVWLNLGQHYNDLTSVFTCAESGLYLFSVTLFSTGELITAQQFYWFQTYTKGIFKTSNPILL